MPSANSLVVLADGDRLSGVGGAEHGGQLLGLYSDGTRMSGLVSLMAQATPAMRPPPPMGSHHGFEIGICSRSSRPIVPWPSMMASLLKGWRRSCRPARRGGWLRCRTVIVGSVEDDSVEALVEGGLDERRHQGHDDAGAQAARGGVVGDGLGVVSGVVVMTADFSSSVKSGSGFC